ncbi:hypothetical protein I6A84_22545 [Frankia sp. CNm7]|uniref:Uncharacterized protein n=1 Tax=Frankia nepalensis TaxID=1836974 RepID=A0A937UQJ3_9ACTN|nr:hypothetical protein [Frankia nepalensis]MBL7498305.1 hypothetical protein [Frankia nepalensis]MBL7509103.1 hypothetical protein [Frankia nepalensis]MBL7520790.1 hypothetical protein [Frankia nepalensis]MBL7630148.1 hypothetical protein [Frankia nepalensis]
MTQDNEPRHDPRPAAGYPQGWPVCVQVPAGWWRIYQLVGDGMRIHVAELIAHTADVDNPMAPPARSVRQPSVWQLEEALGWAIPTPAHPILDSATRLLAYRAAPAADPRTRPATLPETVAANPVFRPWRASVVTREGHAPTSYGRLRHAEHPLVTWTDGPLRIDILAARPRPRLGTGGYRLAYRISDHDRVVLAGQDAALTTDGPQSSSAIRVVAARAAILDTGGHRHGTALPAQQRRLLRIHRARLYAAAAPVGHPYLPGTRVAVRDPAQHTTTTGTVLAHVLGAGASDLRYLWRPDVAALPGHPWRDHPGWALQTPAGLARATVRPPDLNTEPSRGELVLATGAVVRTLDDPRFSVGTVLRALTDDDYQLRYEIQPHDHPSAPVVLPADDIVAIAGTAWPTVTDLLTARATALPLTSGEVLTATHDRAIIEQDVTGPRLRTVARHPQARTVLAPATIPIDVAVAPASPGAEPTSWLTGPTRHLLDPVHGHLAVEDALFTAARQLAPDHLAAILARLPWLPPGPHHPVTAAALAAIHAPHPVAALVAAGPAALPSAHPTPDPSSGPAAPARPDPGASCDGP